MAYFTVGIRDGQSTSSLSQSGFGFRRRCGRLPIWQALSQPDHIIFWYSAVCLGTARWKDDPKTGKASQLIPCHVCTEFSDCLLDQKWFIHASLNCIWIQLLLCSVIVMSLFLMMGQEYLNKKIDNATAPNVFFYHVNLWGYIYIYTSFPM